MNTDGPSEGQPRPSSDSMDHQAYFIGPSDPMRVPAQTTQVAPHMARLFGYNPHNLARSQTVRPLTPDHPSMKLAR